MKTKLKNIKSVAYLLLLGICCMGFFAGIILASNGAREVDKISGFVLAILCAGLLFWRWMKDTENDDYYGM